MKPVYKRFPRIGSLKKESWTLDQKYHREDGPANILYYENGFRECEEWYLNDERHRENGPAKIKYENSGLVKYESWWRFNQFHRENGPASIEYDDNGPAKCKWYLNGKLHRTDGPAGNKELLSWDMIKMRKMLLNLEFSLNLYHSPTDPSLKKI